MKIYLLSTIVLLLLLLPFLRILKRRQKLNSLNYSEEGRNIALGITNCKKLHKELSKMIHPDTITSVNVEKAGRLMQKVNDARFNYKALQDIKLEIDCFLNNK